MHLYVQIHIRQGRCEMLSGKNNNCKPAFHANKNVMQVVKISRFLYIAKSFNR